MKPKWLIVLLPLILLSCKKENDNLPAVTARALTVKQSVTIDSISVNVNVDDDKPGYKVSPVFEGFSYETALLVQDTDYLNANNNVLLQLYKNLGIGVLRIGGNSSDEMDWAGNAKNPGKNVVTTAQVDRLAAFTKASGWPVIFGLNLANKNVSQAVDEASYVYNKLGSNLLSLQNGNEPDFFYKGLRPKSYDYADYSNDWISYFLPIKKQLHNVAFSGPDVTPFNSGWINDFVTQHARGISMVDGHYYVTGPASRADITYNDILTDNKKLGQYLINLDAISTQYSKPYRISECNSIFGQGKPGVSDAFASALWALDFMWKVAENNGQGVNFHGGNTSYYYSPIVHPDGKYLAQPEYYAMLAFKFGAVGQTIVPATLSSSQHNVSVHAAVNRKNYSVTLINKEVNNIAYFHIHFNRAVKNVLINRLIAPSVTSDRNSVSFAAAQVNADGTFKPASTETYRVNYNSITVKLAPASAAVIATN